MTSAPRADVLVVGSGVIGLACAHYLNQAGLQVTALDQGPIGGACSQGNCGYICPSHVLPLTEPGAIGTALKSLFNPRAPFRVKPRFSPAFWNWMWQFARRCNERQMLAAGRELKAILDSSLVEYKRLLAAEQLACEWQENGLLYVLGTEHGWEEFARGDRFLTEQFGVSARRLSGAELTALEPALKPGLAGGFHYLGDCSLRPDLLNAAWAARLRERGVTFLEQCRLLRFEKEGRRVTRLVTSQGELTAERVVVATGAWSSLWAKELECPLPVEQGKGYSVTMARPDPCPRYPMLFPEHRVGVSPFANGYRLGSMMEFTGFDSTIPAHRIQQLQDAAAHFLPSPPPSGELHTWYGWRPMTWDSLPIIGRTPRLENLFVATGHNMLGMSLATATGKLIAELLQGQPPHLDPAPFSPQRFL